jgi:hypothetical protein
MWMRRRRDAAYYTNRTGIGFAVRVGHVRRLSIGWTSPWARRVGGRLAAV